MYGIEFGLTIQLRQTLEESAIAWIILKLVLENRLLLEEPGI